MAKLQVKLKFLNKLPALARKFRFASDTLDKVDSYFEDFGERHLDTTPDTLGENDKRIIEQNLIDTENPHIQLRKTIRIDLEIYNTTRAVLFELFRNGVGNNYLDNSDSDNYYFNKVNNDPDDFTACVKSTRYSIHHIVKDERIGNESERLEKIKKNLSEIVQDYYYIPENDFSDDNYEKRSWIKDRYDDLRKIKYYKIRHNQKNDYLKKYVNDYMLCNITASVSGEWLWNFLKQRLDTCAFYQIQDLAKEIYKQILEEWKPLFKVYKYKKLNLGTDKLDEIHYKLMQLYTEGKLIEKEYLI